MEAYRIVEITKEGKVKSLFHGTNGSREIHLNTWNKCDSKLVRDGKTSSPLYQSGWHFLFSREECEEFFMKMFRCKENRYVIRCEVKGNIRPKHPNGRGKPCFLADEILIYSEDVLKCLV